MDTSACSNITVIAINTINKAILEIKVYPNPTTRRVFLDFSATEIRQATLTIYSIDGKIMQQPTFIQGTLHQLDLPTIAGVYILAIQSEKGIQHYKVIKE